MNEDRQLVMILVARLQRLTEERGVVVTEEEVVTMAGSTMEWEYNAGWREYRFVVRPAVQTVDADTVVDGVLEVRP